MTSATASAPVNPLIGDLAVISVYDREAENHSVEAPGRIIAPALAITASTRSNAKTPTRYQLVHVPSGVRASSLQCGLHIEDVANMAVQASIDWSADKSDVEAAIKAVAGLPKALMGGGCPTWCDGDGPKAPSYEVCCTTCDWESGDESDEGPLSLEDAKRAAFDHECEPRIQIKSPVTGKWHEKYDLPTAESKAAGVNHTTSSEEQQ
jgi:hypothetical protein